MNERYLLSDKQKKEVMENSVTRRMDDEKKSKSILSGSSKKMISDLKA
jgi:hypothetical protein